jgi:hypothetical protein
MQLARAPHRQIIAGTSPHQRNIVMGHVVGAAHHLHLVAGQPVGEQQQHGVLPPLQAVQAGGSVGCGSAQALLARLSPAAAYGDAATSESPEHQASAQRPARGDLPGRAAAHHGTVRQRAAQVLGDATEIMVGGGEHQHQPRGTVQAQLAQGVLQGRVCVPFAGGADLHPGRGLGPPIGEPIPLMIGHDANASR